MANGLECLFICLLAICISSLVKCPLKSFAVFLFLTRLFSDYWVLRVIIYSGYKFFVRYVIGKYFLPVCSLSFILFTVRFIKQIFLVWMKSNLSIFSYILKNIVYISCNYIYNRILFSHKKEGNPAIVTTWIDLEGITLSEISWTEKDRYCMVSLNTQPKKTSWTHRNRE